MTSDVFQFSDPASILADPFRATQHLASLVSRAELNKFDDTAVQEAVLYALENKASFGPCSVIVESLARARGLFPYIANDELSVREELALEAHRPTGMEDVVLHRKQAEVYQRLVAGQSIVLSAPTSFGKSLLIDALIASGRYGNVAVVVPTIALIDETRRRLAERFGDTFKLITHPTQEVSSKNIFVMTQERVLDVDTLPSIDLFVIDEFYKLDPKQDADRALLLNQALHRLLKTGAQFYMLGPSIKEISAQLSSLTGSIFVDTDYATVVTEQINVSPKDGDNMKALVELCRGLHESTLIYCASPASARRVATALAAAGLGTREPKLKGAYDWLAKNYHPDWTVARGFLTGIGVHHGKVPRAIAQYAVRQFNHGRLPYLVCTSTLIEGVNTKAKNVVIFDNKVALKKFDFFTFNNIRGRSGRMLRHFVGRVYLFNAAPQADLPLVDIPLVNQDDRTPDSLLIQLDQEFLTPESQARMTALQKSSLLPIEVLRGNSGVDPGAQNALAKHLWAAGSEGLGMLLWQGFPDYEQLKYACELIWKFLIGKKRIGGTVLSGSQLAWKISRLASAKSVKQLIDLELADQDSSEADRIVEEVLDFVRTWAGFHFPRYLMVLDRIQRAVYMSRNGEAGDYSVYAAKIETLFTTSGLIALDEYGIPIQIAEKLRPYFAQHDTVDEAVGQLRQLDIARVASLTEFERELVQEAQTGLGTRAVPVA
ncbi:helicase [Stenotrophomonas maltophilia AU12-09]|uniref:DEAD/DEAH box helicase n=1 Tax=Stenotrophomonas maltophilia TaxID=40324 RepID=UPI0002BF80B1|nr:DEAD/DEAH box helicase [Stenotrophomonas maltophilia]EMI50490.1 helicase [Stenotrophomonas maltophilia AU12-09]